MAAAPMAAAVREAPLPTGNIPTPKKGAGREWDFIPLGKRVPAEDRQGEERDYPPLFSVDFTLLKDEEDVLARADRASSSYTRATDSAVGSAVRITSARPAASAALAAGAAPSFASSSTGPRERLKAWT